MNVGQEEVDDSSISHVIEYTPWSSLDVSISGEDIDETGFNKATLGEMFAEPQNDRWEPEIRIWNHRYMTKMVRADTFNPQYGNIFFLKEAPARIMTRTLRSPHDI